MNIRVTLAVLLVLLAVVLVVGSILIYWMTVYQPAQFRAQATSTSSTATSAAGVHSGTGASTQATATVVAEATSRVVATQLALGDIYNQATSGTPALNDTLNAQTGSNWDTTQYSNASCGFANGMYDSKTSSGYFNPCLAKAPTFGNLAFQVEMDIVNGHSGGLVVHADTNFSGYYFRMSTDGTFLARRVKIDAQNNTSYTPLFAGRSAAVNTGNNQFNTLMAIVKGSDIYMYINEKFIFKASDSTYKSGLIGVFADSDASDSEIVFRNAQVWKL
jgi:hypothetical protein